MMTHHLWLAAASALSLLTLAACQAANDPNAFLARNGARLATIPPADLLPFA